MIIVFFYLLVFNAHDAPQYTKDCFFCHQTNISIGFVILFNVGWLFFYFSYDSHEPENYEITNPENITVIKTTNQQ